MTTPDYEFIDHLIVTQDGDYASGALVVDTRMWSDADWKELDNAPLLAKQAVAIRISQRVSEKFESFVEQLRNATESTDIEMRRFLIDEDGVTEVDENDNPL
jgi:hypothetical protein